MIESLVEQVQLVLATDDKEEWERVYGLLSSRIESARDTSEAPQQRDIRILKIEKIDVMGAFEPIFLIAMAGSILLSASGVGLWCLAHQRDGGGRIALESAEGRALVDALADAPASLPANKPTATDDAK